MIDLPFKDLVHNSFLYPWVQGGLERIQQGREMRAWVAAGGAGRPPMLLTQGIVRRFAQQYTLRTLVEAGTHLGAMVHALRRDFDRVISIEPDDALWARARLRFAGDPRITIAHGDPRDVLPSLLDTLTTPALFWLNGYPSDGGSSPGARDAPVEREVDLILAHPVRGHVVLLDDPRLVGEGDDPPTLDALRARVAEQRPDLRVERDLGIVRIYAP